MQEVWTGKEMNALTNTSPKSNSSEISQWENIIKQLKLQLNSSPLVLSPACLRLVGESSVFPHPPWASVPSMAMASTWLLLLFYTREEPMLRTEITILGRESEGLRGNGEMCKQSGYTPWRRHTLLLAVCHCDMSPPKLLSGKSQRGDSGSPLHYSRFFYCGLICRRKFENRLPL